MKNNMDSTTLLQYKRGELSEKDSLVLKAELNKSAMLKAELEIIEAIDTLEEISAPDDAGWNKIERKVMQSLKDKDQVSESWFTFNFKPVLAATFSLALIVFASLYILAEPRIEEKNALQVQQPNPSYTVKLPEKVEFDTGSAKATGISKAFKLERSKGNPELAKQVSSLRTIKAGAVLKTGEDDFLHFAFDENVKISMLENTSLRFHEYHNSVMPYLVSGTVVVDITHNPDKKFILLSEKTRLHDIGTKFAVTAENTGQIRVEVEQGEVLIERSGHKSSNVKSGLKASWSDKQEPVVISRAEKRSEHIAQAEQILELFLAEERKALLPKTKAPVKAIKTIATKVEPSEPVQIESKPDEMEVLKTSWQVALDELSPNEQHAVSELFQTVQKQMIGGRTVRAIANLENFIGNNPGALSEKARFMLGECHYNLQEYEKAKKVFMDYLERYPNGTWSEIARMRFAELRNRKE